MNSISLVAHNIAHHFQEGVNWSCYSATHAEPLEKVVKIADRSIRIAEMFCKTLSSSWKHLGTHLRDTITVLESVKVIGAAKLLCCPQENGKYFLVDVAHSWQRRLDRVCLLVHNCFKTVKGLKAVGLAEYGILARNLVGKLPIFTLTMDSFIVLSSVFGTWDSFEFGLPKANANGSEAHSKVAKWKSRPMAIELLRANDEKTLAWFEAHYAKKVEKLSEKVADLRVAGKDAAADKLQVVLAKYELRLAKVLAREGVALADELAPKAEVDGNGKTAIDRKVRKWCVKERNADISAKRNWLRIANNIGKIAIVTWALSVLAMSLSAWPITLSVLALGIIVDSIGLTKILYDEHARVIVHG